MFKFVPSKRAGSQNLEIAGYRYRKNKTTKTKIFYICVEKNCQATTTLDIYLSEITNCPAIHNHPAVDDYIKSAEIRHKILSAVENEPSKNMSEIHEDVVTKKTKMSYQISRIFFVVSSPKTATWDTANSIRYNFFQFMGQNLIRKAVSSRKKRRFWGSCHGNQIFF